MFLIKIQNQTLSIGPEKTKLKYCFFKMVEWINKNKIKAFKVFFTPPNYPF